MFGKKNDDNKEDQKTEINKEEKTEKLIWDMKSNCAADEVVKILNDNEVLNPKVIVVNNVIVVYFQKKVIE